MSELSFIDLFTQVLLGILALWSNIVPYFSNLNKHITQLHFIKIFLVNILIVSYGIYSDYSSGIKTLGISIWLFLFIGSTFWQLYYLNMEDNLPFVGKTLKQMALKTREAYPQQ